MLTNPEMDTRKQQTHLVFERARSLRPMTPSELLAFMQMIRVEDDCWLWTGKQHRHGYGLTHQDGDSAWVHRLSYRHFIGPIPKGFVIDHICESKACVHPAHLKDVTLSQNNLLYHWRRRDAHNFRLPF